MGKELIIMPVNDKYFIPNYTLPHYNNTVTHQNLNFTNYV